MVYVVIILCIAVVGLLFANSERKSDCEYLRLVKVNDDRVNDWIVQTSKTSNIHRALREDFDSLVEYLDVSKNMNDYGGINYSKNDRCRKCKKVK